MKLKRLLLNIFSLVFFILAVSPVIFGMEENAEFSCSICFDAFNKSNLKVLTCHHVFCKECIEKWAESSKTCPVCRKPLVYNTMAFNQYLDNYYNPVAHTVESCSICKQNYKIEDSITILQCNREHVFHAKCITRLILAKAGRAVCPLCYVPVHIESEIVYDPCVLHSNFDEGQPVLYNPHGSVMLPKLAAPYLINADEDFKESSEDNTNQFSPICIDDNWRVYPVEESPEPVPALNHEDLERTFIQAVKNNDRVVAQLCLEKGVDPTMGAVIISHKSIAKLLPLRADTIQELSRLSTVNEETMLPLGSLHLAAFYGSTNIVELLLAYDIPIDVPAAMGLYPLHWASIHNHVEIVDVLIRHGARVDTDVSPDNMQAIHYAAKAGHTNVVQKLMEHGAHIDAQSRDGSTPLHYALSAGHVNTVELLACNGATLTVPLGESNFYPLHLAITARVSEQARILIVECLLKCGASIHARDIHGHQAIHYAAHDNCQDIVKLLVDSGADLNATTYAGSKPVDLAQKAGHYALARWLNNQNSQNENLLHRQNNVVRPVLARTIPHVSRESRASLPVQTNQREKLPDEIRDENKKKLNQVLSRQQKVKDAARIRNALQNQDFAFITQFLQENVIQPGQEKYRNIDLIHAAAIYGNVGIVKLMISTGAEIDQPLPNTMMRPLHFAAMYGHSEIMKLLIHQGADIHKPAKIYIRGIKHIWRDNEKHIMQPIHMAAFYGQLEVVKLLKSYVASIFATDDEGNQPIHFAAANGHVNVIEWLVAQGADINVKNKDGDRPLDLAEANGRKQLLEWFKKTQGSCLIC